MQWCNQYKVGAHLDAFGMHCFVNAMLCKGMNAHGTSSSSRAPRACPALVLMSATDHQLVIHDMTVHTQSVQTHIGCALQHAWYLPSQVSCCRSLYI